MAITIGLYKTLLMLFAIICWTGLLASPVYSSREKAASLVAFVWQFLTALAICLLYVRWQHWEVPAQKSLVEDVPVDFLASHSILLGSCVTLFLRKQALSLKLLLSGAVLITLYCIGPVLPSAVGNIPFLASLLFCSLSPSLILGHCATGDHHPLLRSALQSLAWAGVLLWVLPSLLFQHPDYSWSPLLQRPLEITLAYSLPLLLPVSLLCSALWQFASEGEGTAFPYDPPKRLVVGGIYAYLSNPMQVGICLLMFWWGFVLEALPVSLSAGVAFILFLVFKHVCNGSCDIGEKDPFWRIYQAEVPKWLPRRKAWRKNVS